MQENNNIVKFTIYVSMFDSQWQWRIRDPRSYECPYCPKGPAQSESGHAVPSDLLDIQFQRPSIMTQLYTVCRYTSAYPSYTMGLGCLDHIPGNGQILVGSGKRMLRRNLSPGQENYFIIQPGLECRKYKQIRRLNWYTFQSNKDLQGNRQYPTRNCFHEFLRISQTLNYSLF